MDLSVIYVTYRTPTELLMRSMDSVRTAALQAKLSVEFIIADNGGLAREHVGTGDVRVVGSGENIGFGRMVNRAVAETRGERVLLMNPDSTMSSRGLVELERARRTVGALSLFGALLVADGRPQVHAYNVWWSSIGLLVKKHAWKEELDRIVRLGEVVEVDRLCGAGLYARRQELLSLGPFDESFFLYGEDVDLSLRAKSKMFRLFLVPRAVILHDAGTSSDGVSELVERARTDAHLRLLTRHCGWMWSLLGRLEFAVITVGGWIVGRGRGHRMARFDELKRWGLHRLVPPVSPSWDENEKGQRR
jgi:GT2 family glycosyltransferase